MELLEKEDTSRVSLDSMDQYFREINKIPLLSDEEEKELLIKVVKNDPKAKQKLIEANLRLVVSEAKKYASAKVSINDLVQVGNIGLIKAVDKYDLSKQTKFSTHAVWWIRQEILKDLSNNSRTIRLTSPKFYQISKYNKVKEKLYSELKRKPTKEEIASELGTTVETIDNFLIYRDDVESLNILVGEDKENEIIEFVEAEDNTENTIIENHLVEDMQKLILNSNLSSRDKDIIIRRYGLFGKEEETLEEIGKKYQITKERVRVILLNSIKILLETKEAKNLKAYIDDNIEGIVDLKKEELKRSFLEFVKDCKINHKEIQILTLQLGLFGNKNHDPKEIAKLLKRKEITIVNHQKVLLNKVTNQEDSQTKQKMLTLIRNNTK